jgi:hypothetical protein
LNRTASAQRAVVACRASRVDRFVDDVSEALKTLHRVFPEGAFDVLATYDASPDGAASEKA